MTRAVLVYFGLVAGFVMGLLAGVWLRRVSRADNDEIAYRALRCVHQENAGLTAQTRALVIDAISEHESRNPSPRPRGSGSSVNGSARRTAPARRAPHEPSGRR